MANRKAAISRVMAATTTGKLLAGTPEVAIAGAEADLCLPGDVPEDFWQALGGGLGAIASWAAQF